MEITGLGRTIIGSGDSKDQIYRITAILIRAGLPKYKLPAKNIFGFKIKALYKEVIIMFVDYNRCDDVNLKKIHFLKTIKILEANHIKFIAKEIGLEISLL